MPLGIEVRDAPPAGDPDLEAPCDPLGDLARSSGFHVRPVTPAGGLVAPSRGEPLLGQLNDDGRPPVALLPANRSTALVGGRLRAARSRGPRTSRRRPSSPAGSRRRPGRSIGRSPTHRSGSATCSGSAAASGAWRASWGASSIVAFFGALLGLAIPIASGILVDQVIPEADCPGSP